jgi:hypothetical protein
MLAPVFIMIYAEVIFWSNDIKDMNVVLPFPPRVGENIEFPIGTVKYNNGAELDDRNFKIKHIDWVFIENSMIPKYKFQKLSIYVERP